MRNQDPAEVQSLYVSGVHSIQTATGEFDDALWDAPACGQWTASDTARHLVGVINWYHDWLDRAMDGDSSQPFRPEEFTERNQADVDRHADLSGPDAVSLFANRALDYLARARLEWERPYGFPLGEVTVGLHLGVAATEWHLHAWDLTASSSQRHEPDQPDQLFVAAGSAVAVTKGGVRGEILQRLVYLGSERSPWSALLKRSGR